MPTSRRCKAWYSTIPCSNTESFADKYEQNRMFYVQKYIICMTFDGGMRASRPTVCIADSSEELIIGYLLLIS